MIVCIFPHSFKGKSKFVEKILRKSKTYSTVSWDTVLLCYEVEQRTYDSWYECAKKFVYHKGWPDEVFVEGNLKNADNNLIIFGKIIYCLYKNYSNACLFCFKMIWKSQ